VAEAIAKYREAVTADPTAADAWEPLCQLLLDAGRLAEAGQALTTLATLYQEAGRPAETERVIASAVGDAPTADRYALAVKLWTSLGDKGRAIDLRTAARKAVGDAALRKAEAAQRK